MSKHSQRTLEKQIPLFGSLAKTLPDVAGLESRLWNLREWLRLRTMFTMVDIRRLPSYFGLYFGTSAYHQNGPLRERFAVLPWHEIFKEEDSSSPVYDRLEYIQRHPFFLMASQSAGLDTLSITIDTLSITIDVPAWMIDGGPGWRGHYGLPHGTVYPGQFLGEWVQEMNRLEFVKKTIDPFFQKHRGLGRNLPPMAKTCRDEFVNRFRYMLGLFNQQFPGYTPQISVDAGLALNVIAEVMTVLAYGNGHKLHRRIYDAPHLLRGFAVYNWAGVEPRISISPKGNVEIFVDSHEDTLRDLFRCSDALQPGETPINFVFSSTPENPNLDWREYLEDVKFQIILDFLAENGWETLAEQLGEVARLQVALSRTKGVLYA